VKVFQDRRTMNPPIDELIIAMVGILPAAYGIACWIRRSINTLRMAQWVRQNYRQQWQELHWLARRHNQAGINVLITKGLISGPEVDAWRRRDEQLEKGTWLGLFGSALLLLVLLTVKYLFTL
jgi:hypothetical protein